MGKGFGIGALIALAVLLSGQGAGGTVKKSAAEAQTSLKTGVVSDFDKNEHEVMFGFGWEVSTDSVVGGKSAGELKVVAGGACQTEGSLLIKGEIAPGIPYVRAGAMFYPGILPHVSC